MRRVSLQPDLIGILFIAAHLISACNSEILEKQAQQIEEQKAEIAQQRREIDDLIASQQKADQQRRDCTRAFRDFFEKAEAARNRDQAIDLYRRGLALCPEDEVAHYELGKAFVERGLYVEAEREFEAALKTNPGFIDARNQLEALRKYK